MATLGTHLLVIGEEAATLVSGLQQHGVTLPTILVHRWNDALNVLLETEEAERFRQPGIILLETDTSEGIRFLEQLRNTRNLRRNVVFLLTSRDDNAFKQLAYDHCIAGYLVKARLDNHFEKLAKLLNAYSSIVALPEHFSA